MTADLLLISLCDLCDRVCLCVCWLYSHYTPRERAWLRVHVLLYRRVIGWHVCSSCQQPETKTTSSSVSEAQMLMFNPFSSYIRGVRSHDASMLASMSRFHGLFVSKPPGWTSAAAWVDVSAWGDFFQCVGVCSRASVSVRPSRIIHVCLGGGSQSA